MIPNLRRAVYSLTKKKYIDDFKAAEVIRLEASNIKKNSGKRIIAKLNLGKTEVSCKTSLKRLSLSRSNSIRY